jgi:hypothetical protein
MGIGAASGIFDHLSPRPRLADEVEQEADRDFGDVKEALHDVNAAPPGKAMPHPDGQLADPIARAVQQEDNLGLRVILGVPVGERPDHPAVGGAEAAGAVGDLHAR